MLHGGWPDSSEDEGPQRYGLKAATWRPVQEQQTLGDLLAQPDYVVPGVPVLFVTAKGTEFRERFLAGDVPLL